MHLKSDLVKNLIIRLSEDYPSLTDTAVKESVNAILEKIIRNIEDGNRMEIRGFGHFDVSYHPERLARDPRTGQRIPISARHRLHFKAGKELLERVNAT